AQKLSPRDEVGVCRIVKLVFPEDDLDDFGRRVLDFDAIGKAVKWSGFRSTRFGNALFYCRTATVERVAVWIPDSLRIVDSRVACEVSVLWNHRTCRRIALHRRRI